MFVVTEMVPKRFFQESQDLKFVAEIMSDIIPRIGETLTVNGSSWKVVDVERNYDINQVYVYVSRKNEYGD